MLNITENLTRRENFDSEKFGGLKKFLVWKNFGPQKLKVRKNSGSKKFGVLKKFECINFGLKKSFNPKKILSNKFWVKKVIDKKF